MVPQLEGDEMVVGSYCKIISNGVISQVSTSTVAVSVAAKLTHSTIILPSNHSDYQWSHQISIGKVD
jgi:hypothetical protein